MSFLSTGLFGLMKDKMAYLGQRQAVLAQNVANADTPGYKAMDLAPFTFGDALKRAGSSGTMSVTDARHIIPASMAGVNSSSRKMGSFEVLPSGNEVDLEQQAMEVSKTAIDYQTILAIYHKVTMMFRTALGK